MYENIIVTQLLIFFDPLLKPYLTHFVTPCTS